MHAGTLTNRQVTDYKQVALSCPIYEELPLLPSLPYVLEAV